MIQGIVKLVNCINLWCRNKEGLHLQVDQQKDLLEDPIQVLDQVVQDHKVDLQLVPLVIQAAKGHRVTFKTRNCCSSVHRLWLTECWLAINLSHLK